MDKDEQKQYIQTLENSIEFLNKEIEFLKSNRKQKKEQEALDYNSSNYPEPSFFRFKSVVEAEISLFEYLSKKFNILEIILIKINYSFVVEEEYLDKFSVSLSKTYTQLVESGVINWLLSNSNPVIIPNLKDENTTSPTSLILSPLELMGSKYILIAKTSDSKDSIAEQDLDRITKNVFHWLLLNNSVNSTALKHGNNNYGFSFDSNDNSHRITTHEKLNSEIEKLIIEKANSLFNSIESNAQFIKKGIGNTSLRIDFIINETEYYKRLIKYSQEVNNLNHLISFWNDLLSDEGTIIELNLTNKNIAWIDEVELIHICNIIIDFSNKRHESLESVKLFDNNNLQQKTITLSVSSLKLGNSDSIDNVNYKELNLPKAILSLFNTVEKYGYYLTITDDTELTYFEIAKK